MHRFRTPALLGFASALIVAIFLHQWTAAPTSPNVTHHRESLARKVASTPASPALPRATVAPQPGEKTTHDAPQIDSREALAAFGAWSERFLAAAPAERDALRAEGVTLARARQPEFLRLIKEQPERAL